MLTVNHKSATYAAKSVSCGPARVTTRLAIGLHTHGSILICSPKNSSRLLDTFFRNPCILVPDTETQSSVNGVVQGYLRAGERGLQHSLESALVFTRLNAAQRWVPSAPRTKKGPHWLADRTVEDRDSDKKIPVDYNCREKWTQHSQPPRGTSGRINQREKGGQVWQLDY